MRGGPVLRKRNVTSYSKEDVRTKFTSEDVQNNKFSYRGRLGGQDYGDWGYARNDDLLAPSDLRKKLQNALSAGDQKSLRELSRHFFKISGTYSRAAYYMSWLPTYDSLLVPVVLKDTVSKERIMSELISALNFLENMKVKTSLKEIALDVVVDGIYYGYLRTNAGNVVLQKLPTDFCRTKYKINGFPVVEFDVRYFDLNFPMDKVKLKVLNSFPAEVVEGYAEFKRGNIDAKFEGIGEEYGAWVTLDPDAGVAFYFDEKHRPLLSNAFFAIIDVLEMKGIEKEKAEEQLYNLIIQKVPLTKEGEFIFDMEEAKAMHQNASGIFRETNKTDVLTTFGDMDMLNLNESQSEPVDLDSWKKDIYSDLGISSQLFSTEGNLALEKSLMVDESLIYYLVEKFDSWLNHIIGMRFNRTPTKYYFKLWIPPITHNNRIEMSKHYKELATLGYSKFLPALALGQSQLLMMATASFENEILELNNIMKPLQSSHTAAAAGGGKGGRPPLDNSEKSDKTIQNQNS